MGDFVEGYYNRGERPELNQSSAPLKQKAGEFLRPEVRKFLGYFMFPNCHYQNEK